MKYKYSVTTFWLLSVPPKSEKTIKWVNRWVRISKDYFKTKKEAVLFASKHTCSYYEKSTIKKEV